MLRYKNGQMRYCKHGMCGTRFYSIWKGIRSRCLVKSSSGYKKYGARGITVSDNWNIFTNFMIDMYEEYFLHVKIHGEKNTFIDRKNGGMGYCKENCRWVTPDESLNNRFKDKKKFKKIKLLSYKGKKVTIHELSEILNISTGAIHYRIKNNLTICESGKYLTRDRNPDGSFCKKKTGIVTKIINNF